ncbi:Macrophage mannose receptor 1 [Amphibalanus amphitrite]|uniref:Macrophage mannose receptor 1 n=1 Tax=Amphibalanus amphitrite TaxID=1232801 RepID=A0A6A4V9G9_AMPAM|nr:Macrophage mannose receptor 1 [Amphibalanus amphitrite]
MESLPPPRDDSDDPTEEDVMRGSEADGEPIKPGTCSVLQSGILECDGRTPREARSAAENHLVSLPDSDVCPDDGDECPAAEDMTYEELDCPLTWMRLEDACYAAAYRMRATQRRARRYCRSVGGHLIHPISAREVRHFTAFFTDLWVGAEYNQTVGEWQWLDGTPLESNVTILGGRTPEKGRRCVRVRARDGAAAEAGEGAGEGSFIKTNCGGLYPFLCRAPLLPLIAWQKAKDEEKARHPEPAPTADNPCPRGWTAIAGWCHHSPRLVGEWANGELWCNDNRNSKLVSLRSREHELAVDKLVGNGSWYHIGMRYRRTPKNWGWMDGSKVEYTNWKHGRPPTFIEDDNRMKDTSCSYRYVDKDYWQMADCREQRVFVCAFKPELPEDQAETDKDAENVKETEATETPHQEPVK